MSQDGNIPLYSHNIGLLTGSLFLLRIKDLVASGKLRHIRKCSDILSIHAAHASLKSGCRARPTWMLTRLYYFSSFTYEPLRRDVESQKNSFLLEGRDTLFYASPYGATKVIVSLCFISKI